jgi:DNA polymerase I-like protein with 3'-5' exonuclease and polymerase domains
MKQALVILDQALKELGVYYKFVANIHDEWQIECTEYSAPIVGNEAVKAIRKVQDCFNLNCPLDGEYKIGKTWAETH